MITTSTLASMRLARKPTLLAGMEHVFFVNPIRVGENAVFTSWVEYVGRSSMEVTTVVEAEDPSTGRRKLTTVAHTTHVAVGPDLRPVPVEACVDAVSSEERRLQEEAIARRERRAQRISRRKELVRDLTPPRPLDERYVITSYRFAYPEDVVFHNAVFAGKLMYYLDELAGIIGLRYARGPVVTAAVDATDFYAPILVGESIEMTAALTYVGRSSMEVTIKVVARNEARGDARHTTTSYFTVVHIGKDGRPEPVPPFEVREGWQRRLVEEAKRRREVRLKLLAAMKETGAIKPF
jgi:acyl-CoA hydrolase